MDCFHTQKYSPKYGTKNFGFFFSPILSLSSAVALYRFLSCIISLQDRDKY